MTDKDKYIRRTEGRDFEKALFENDFFEVSADDSIEQDASEHSEDNASGEESEVTQEDLAQAESEGYSKGLTDGKKQAFEDYTAELKKQTEKLSAALQDVQTARREILADTQDKAFTVLEVITQTLLADAREKYPQTLLKNALDVLTQVSETQKKTLAIHTAPETEKFLTETLLKAGKIEGISAENIHEDSKLEPGDCIIEWTGGGVDLRLDKLRDDITAALRGAAKTPEAEASPAEDANNKDIQDAEDEKPESDPMVGTPDSPPPDNSPEETEDKNEN